MPRYYLRGVLESRVYSDTYVEVEAGTLEEAIELAESMPLDFDEYDRESIQLDFEEVTDD